jgi:oligopeptide/dipeptide ABC transporter ATP-binding protein
VHLLVASVHARPNRESSEIISGLRSDGSPQPPPPPVFARIRVPAGMAIAVMIRNGRASAPGIEKTSAALMLISHDLAVIASMCETVVVVYAGMVLEVGAAADIMSAPLSPYTQGLVKSSRSDGQISFIPGRIPEPGGAQGQCPFVERCQLATERCRLEPPPLRELQPNRWVACHNI